MPRSWIHHVAACERVENDASQGRRGHAAESLEHHHVPRTGERNSSAIVHSSRVRCKNKIDLSIRLTQFYFRLNPDITRDDEDEMGTLCQCALKAVKDFLPETKLTQILSHLLAQERSDTLSK